MGNRWRSANLSHYFRFILQYSNEIEKYSVTIAIVQLKFCHEDFEKFVA